MSARTLASAGYQVAVGPGGCHGWIPRTLRSSGCSRDLRDPEALRVPLRGLGRCALRGMGQPGLRPHRARPAPCQCRGRLWGCWPIVPRAGWSGSFTRRPCRRARCRRAGPPPPRPLWELPRMPGGRGAPLESRSGPLALRGFEDARPSVTVLEGQGAALDPCALSRDGGRSAGFPAHLDQGLARDGQDTGGLPAGRGIPRDRCPCAAPWHIKERSGIVRRSGRRFALVGPYLELSCRAGSWPSSQDGRGTVRLDRRRLGTAAFAICRPRGSAVQGRGVTLSAATVARRVSAVPRQRGSRRRRVRPESSAAHSVDLSSPSRFPGDRRAGARLKFRKGWNA